MSFRYIAKEWGTEAVSNELQHLVVVEVVEFIGVVVQVLVFLLLTVSTWRCSRGIQSTVLYSELNSKRGTYLTQVTLGHEATVYQTLLVQSRVR